MKYNVTISGVVINTEEAKPYTDNTGVVRQQDHIIVSLNQQGEKDNVQIKITKEEAKTLKQYEPAKFEVVLSPYKMDNGYSGVSLKSKKLYYSR